MNCATNLPAVQPRPGQGAREGTDCFDSLTLTAHASSQDWSYSGLKALATTLGQPVRNLIALAPQNDPFYCGMPADVEAAEWFCEQWRNFGFGRGTHIRRVYYRLVNHETPVLMPGGKRFENIEGSWNYITKASKAARYLGLVDADDFDDRRNPEPSVYLTPYSEIASIHYNPGGLGFQIPDFPALPQLSANIERSQPYHLEIWCEKSTMNDILKPLCQEYQVNLVTGLGELSVTTANRLVRNRVDCRPIRILYVSDFDPAGKSMPVSASRKLEFFIRKRRPDLDVKLFPVVLTQEQVQEFKLPRIPIKDSEARKAGFEATYGTGATELDALEALHPGRLRKILEEHIGRYYDHALSGEVYAQRQSLQSELDRYTKFVHDAHKLEISRLRERFTNIKRELDSWNEAARGEWQAITHELFRCEINAHEFLPQAQLAIEDDDALFDSKRDYLTQIEHYKAFQRGGGQQL